MAVALMVVVRANREHVQAKPSLDQALTVNKTLRRSSLPAQIQESLQAESLEGKLGSRASKMRKTRRRSMPGLWTAAAGQAGATPAGSEAASMVSSPSSKCADRDVDVTLSADVEYEDGRRVAVSASPQHTDTSAAQHRTGLAARIKEAIVGKKRPASPAQPESTGSMAGVTFAIEYSDATHGSMFAAVEPMPELPAPQAAAAGRRLDFPGEVTLSASVAPEEKEDAAAGLSS
eukprot:2141601-Rhodomonas_salina.1